MAFSEDLITRLGLDTRPFQRQLRGARGLVEDFSKKVNQSLSSKLGGIVGVAGIITALKSVADLAREAKKEGKEFSEQGWISRENAEAISTFADRFKSVLQSTKEFLGYWLGQSAQNFFKAADYLGALSATGSHSKAMGVLKEMAAEQQRAAQFADEQKRKAEAALKAEAMAAKNAKESLEEEKSLEDHIRESTYKQYAEQQRITAELQKQTAELARQKATLASAKADMAKFTLSELASSPFRFRGRLAQEKVVAQQVVRLEGQAEFLKSIGANPAAFMLQERARGLRAGLTNVVDADRFPFKHLEKSAAETAQRLNEISAEMKQGGIPVKVPMA